MKFRAELNFDHMKVDTINDGEQDETQVSMTLKNPSMPITKLKGLFPTEVGYELLEGFYQENGELECNDIGAILLNIEGVGVAASLKTEFGNKEMSFEDGAKINRFKVTLLPGKRAELSCRLQVYPTNKEVGEITGMLNQALTVAASWKKTAQEEAAERQQELDIEKEQRAAGEPKEEEAPVLQ